MDFAGYRMDSCYKQWVDIRQAHSHPDPQQREPPVHWSDNRQGRLQPPAWAKHPWFPL